MHCLCSTEVCREGHRAALALLGGAVSCRRGIPPSAPLTPLIPLPVRAIELWPSLAHNRKWGRRYRSSDKRALPFRPPRREAFSFARCAISACHALARKGCTTRTTTIVLTVLPHRSRGFRRKDEVCRQMLRNEAGHSIAQLTQALALIRMRTIIRPACACSMRHPPIAMPTVTRRMRRAV